MSKVPSEANWAAAGSAADTVNSRPSNGARKQFLKFITLPPFNGAEFSGEVGRGKAARGR
jgi:hypothetical protein